jgi:hypothetical protein
MVTCPWCGTSYAVFQSNCSKCGGPIHPPEIIEAARESPLAPPAAPRPITNSYALKLMTSDGWSIAGLVFLIMGIIFAPLGLALTLGIVTAFVGLPFLFLGVIFLAASVGILSWRYRLCKQQIQVLKWGEATLGNVTNLQENYSVEVNGRHPWSIDYQYRANGQTYTGQVTTLSQPGNRLQPGCQVYVLYMGDNPTLSSLYPHP